MEALTRLYRIRHTCLQMLKDRGYLMSQVRVCVCMWLVAAAAGESRSGRPMQACTHACVASLACHAHPT